ncbi:hypothetical protein CLAFUW4_00082 [Fulvia fulva]|uniref:Uncharacterized protein n=1 Tax=Passalora fulva TaxID=5499 RepID=A0A9Q8L5P8_PASFU|nr:uncharacterized protein CLAFUR5_00080 [Fulvia fulva]KAK4635062.1 hypothetical protein CLAFUR4_00082 [Fulvia fulva]KAK4638373.1 hypothetical protein CLAFUR0_00081 [Fulvia fulva]UJO11346.1 hypothetical protein CLAFUR5_00080 [Fulvia fulva]WPV09935.1 hypothetical protein CLAFUW4_00082 [Fulvia fulva]WPV23226.1 hypothetical protein CLAFUW7_00082 [Fulvia fulva]
MSTVAKDTKALSVLQSSRGFIQRQLPAWLQPAVGQLCSHLPQSWFGDLHLTDTARAFGPMLQTLKTAGESYLGMVDCLHTIGVSLPRPISPQLHGSLQSAASSLSLSLLDPRFSRLPAGVYAASGYGVAAKCRNFPTDYCDEARLMLAIDYSRAALTAALIHEDVPLYRTLRTFHSETLGGAALDRTCSSPDRRDLDCTAGLRVALTNITKLPASEDEDAKEITFVQTIVVHGESASDFRLNSVLRDVLSRGDDDDDGGNAMEFIVNGGQSSSHVSPLYAAARGIAEFGWLVIDEPLPDGCNCNDFTRRRMC